MQNSSYHILGVMSGTSCDGIDLAEVIFNYSKQGWSYSIKTAETLTYSSYWQNTLPQADRFDSEQIDILNKKYTVYLAEKIKTFIQEKNLNNLNAIASHGHTIFHQPERKYTLQIGNLRKLATLTGQKVVCDFRVQDVQLGGQGAPLVPIGDRILFSEYAACINLGGFANISLENKQERIAFDICPFNIVLNVYAEKLGLEYDDRGKLATEGKLEKNLLKKLDSLQYYQSPPPKSLGKEWVREHIFPLIAKYNMSPKNVLRTFSEHIIEQIYRSIKDIPKGKILLTGGGTYNDFIIESLINRTKHELVIPDKKLIDYKEALIFALLGVLRIRGEINVLKSVTGAKKNHSSGRIFLP